MRYTAKVARGIAALLMHARNGFWGDDGPDEDGGEDALREEVAAACDWIEAQADKRKTSGRDVQLFGKEASR